MLHTSHRLLTLHIRFSLHILVFASFPGLLNYDIPFLRVLLGMFTLQSFRLSISTLDLHGLTN
jgi:hypothetical protein